MTRTRLIVLPAMVLLVAAVAACSSATGNGSRSSSSGASPGASSSGSGSTSSPAGPGAQGTGCVSQDEAMRIWTDIDTKLNAVELDPKHAGAANVATGQALENINQYLQSQLISNNWTEKEVDKLESLSIIDAGCNGGDLTVQVSEKVVQDDYLKPDGKLDHSDTAVGTTLQLVETFVRDNGTWKESDFRDASQPTASPQIF